MSEVQGYSVAQVHRVNRVSKKTGNQYQVLVITFENGYTMDVFLNNEQQYILHDVPVI